MMNFAKNLLRKPLKAAGYRFLHFEVDSGPALRFHLRKVLKRLDVNCVLDVGANRGEYAQLLREEGYTGDIISFEPNKETYQYLSEIARKDARWSVHNMALGSEETTQTLNVATISCLSSLLAPTEYAETVFGKEMIAHTQRIEVKRLDSIYRELVKHISDPRVFLKMDTQGYDLEVIKGAAGCLQNVLGLQSEISVRPLYENTPNYLESLAEYHSLGFNLTGLFTVNLDSQTFNIVEYDCVMIRN